MAAVIDAVTAPVDPSRGSPSAKRSRWRKAGRHDTQVDPLLDTGYFVGKPVPYDEFVAEFLPSVALLAEQPVP